MPLKPPSRNSRFKSGVYDASKSKKFRGPSFAVKYRSSYEYRFIIGYCENNPNVIEWSYETLAIPYIGPTGKSHNYYIDFIITYKNGDTYLIEVKPYCQTLEQHTGTFRQNSAKWSAAKKYCAARNLKFAIVTEKTLEALGI
jgi:hypothetical protein